jgi:hypothetical protein
MAEVEYGVPKVLQGGDSEKHDETSLLFYLSLLFLFADPRLKSKKNVIMRSQSSKNSYRLSRPPSTINQEATASNQAAAPSQQESKESSTVEQTTATAVSTSEPSSPSTSSSATSESVDSAPTSPAAETQSGSNVQEPTSENSKNVPVVKETSSFIIQQATSAIRKDRASVEKRAAIEQIEREDPLFNAVSTLAANRVTKILHLMASETVIRAAKAREWVQRNKTYADTVSTLCESLEIVMKAIISTLKQVCVCDVVMKYVYIFVSDFHEITPSKLLGNNIKVKEKF